MARQYKGAPEGAGERNRIAQLCQVSHEREPVHSNIVGALALGLEEANRGGGGGRHGAVQHEEALCWRRDAICTPKAGLSKPLPLSKAIVPIEGVRRVHGKRRDAQPRVC